jgi:hypothetical protein
MSATTRRRGMSERKKRKRAKDDELEELDESGVDYPDTKAKQDEFEQLAREEGFDEAAEDTARRKKPRDRGSTTSHMP